MATIPRKVSGRLVKNVSRFQKILQIAKKRDVNESDTVAIVTDMLSEIFGYDKYLEITSELIIRGTYCDLAIKVDGKFAFLVECKAIGLDLKENHLKQVVNYGANKGIQWVILTNGIVWHIYRICFEKPINYHNVMTLNFEKLYPKKDKDIEMLYALSREGLKKNVIEDYYERVKSVNRFILGNLILGKKVLDCIRKELRKFAGGVKVSHDEISDLIEKEVLKREIIEGVEAEDAKARINKYFKRNAKRKKSVDIMEKLDSQENDRE